MRLYHESAFLHDLIQRHDPQVQRELARLDHSQIKNFIDEVQQIPPSLKNLVNISLLGSCWRWCTRFNKLGKPKNGAKRRTQFMAHVGEKIRLRAIGFFRRAGRVFQCCVLVQKLMPNACPLGIGQPAVSDVIENNGYFSAASPAYPKRVEFEHAFVCRQSAFKPDRQTTAANGVVYRYPFASLVGQHLADGFSEHAGNA